MKVRKWFRRLAMVAGLMLAPFVAAAIVGMMPPTIPAIAKTRAWFIDAQYLGSHGVRLQQADVDCGVAALEMLLEGRADYRRLSALRTLVIQRDSGLTLLEMQRAALQLGVVTEGILATLPGLRSLPLPLIVHVDQHYAVLDRILPSGEFELRDPAIGRVRMSPDALAGSWSGAVLALKTPRTDSVSAKTADVRGTKQPLADSNPPRGATIR